MATKFDAAAYNFRKKFPFIGKDLLRWFPGHMNKGLKQMQRKLKSVDCVIEVHDARLPFSGRNPIFTSTLTGAKPHILVLNKKDLTIQSLIPRVKDQLKAEQGVNNVVFTNSKDQLDRGLKALIPLMVDLMKDSNRFNRSEEEDYNVMIIGVPNVGKSSLINMLRSRNMRKGHALPVGAVAGLALCASLQDHLVGEEAIADYLLYWLNSHGKFQYVEYMGLDEPYLVETAKTMVKAFRKGELGKLMLDVDLLNERSDRPGLAKEMLIA
ncbi:Mitochondrial GTPase 1 [Operophtera brumata]|uniref:Mitochondrial GTPase 1 n=1 Tax=Operophtera brumata TaxID=104452 RepID=A0A0L7KVK9_OPEBR|nr:Mitochondrial GTPase 1 [Operophtera brumata]